MLLFPNCKINIGLNIVGRRNDGYHDLETVFYPVFKLHDALEIVPTLPGDVQKDSQSADRIKDFKTVVTDQKVFNQIQPFPGFQFRSSGLRIEGNPENNLCLKACQLLKKDFPDLPPVDVCLHKAIPMGAGLGGGSADGAFTLQLLNQQFQLQLPVSQLLHYALQLGSDCPFFMINKPAFACGRGEVIEEISLNLSGYAIVLIHPGIHISTTQAFADIRPTVPAICLKELIDKPIETWRKTIKNDFEESVFAQHSLLNQIKNKLYETGATYAAMSGSGSTVYGIYHSEHMPLEKLYPDFFEIHAGL